MKRIDYFLLGYVEVRIEPIDMPKAINALLRANLSADFDKEGMFKVSLPRLKKYTSALIGTNYTVSEAKGAVGFLIKNRKRYGAFTALALLAVYFIFVSNFIWDVRIEGNERLADSLVEEELCEAGIYIGRSWSALSRSEAERALLENSDDIGWVNINRRGNVAYVTIKEKNIYDNPDDIKGYSNIIASYDCVIEEITVKSGIAVVRAGDTVKKGQLLISGIIPSELGGGFVRAEGEVLGRVSEDISVEVSRDEDVIFYENEVLSEAYINFFNFSVNIFKRYGKSDIDCAIIEDVKVCVLFGNRLPIKIVRIYNQPVSTKHITRTDKELTSVAAYRLSKVRHLKLCDAQLLRMSTYGEFTDDGYKMSSSVTVLRDVGEERYFN